MDQAFVEPRLLRRSVTVLLALAAAAQVGGLAWTASSRLARLPDELETFWAPQPATAPNAAILAFRAFRKLAPQIPKTMEMEGVVWTAIVYFTQLLAGVVAVRLV